MGTDNKGLTDGSAKADLISRLSELTALLQERRAHLDEAARLEIETNELRAMIVSDYGDDLPALSKLISGHEASPNEQIYLDQVIIPEAGSPIATKCYHCLHRAVRQLRFDETGSRSMDYRPTIADAARLHQLGRVRGYGRACHDYANAQLMPYGITLQW
jgi:hypothetical protein